jgi:hypothetical protein
MVLSISLHRLFPQAVIALPPWKEMYLLSVPAQQKPLWWALEISQYPFLLVTLLSYNIIMGLIIGLPWVLAALPP